MATVFYPLIVEPVDRRVLDAEIASALQSPETQIFLDTNILMWMYGLHRRARQELVDWLLGGPQAGRIHIPRRAVHEFSLHRNKPEELYPFGRQFKTLPKLLPQIIQFAHLIIDDELASNRGLVDRKTYLGQLQKTIKEADRLISPLIKAEKLDSIHDMLIPAFNSLALESDVFADISRLRAEYEARAEIRMPPGFADESKGKKQARSDEETDAPPLAGTNRFGDFAIWEEIIMWCGESARSHIETVIIITHDRKIDWSYAPLKIIDSDGRTKPNPVSGPERLTVAQPLLVQEIRKRTRAQALYILTIPQLAAIASNIDIGFKLPEISQAVQVEVTLDSALQKSIDDTGATTSSDEVLDSIASAQDDERVAETFSEDVPSESGSESIEIVEFLNHLPAMATADRQYSPHPDGKTTFESVIKRLKSHNWYAQNPAVEDGIAALNNGDVSLLQAFIFGRNLYQAAVGTAAKAIQVLEDLPSQFTTANKEAANAVYAGALFEIYFDSNGEIRDRPKSEQISILLLHQTDSLFCYAVDWISARLEPVKKYFLVTPSRTPKTVNIDIRFDDNGMILSLFCNAVSLSRPCEAESDGYPLPKSVTFRRLRSQVSYYFGVPESQLTLSPEFGGTRRTSDIALVRWGPGTGLLLSPGTNE